MSRSTNTDMESRLYLLMMHLLFINIITTLETVNYLNVRGNLLLLFYPITIYMIRCVYNLLYDIYKIMNEHSQICNRYVSLMFPTQFDTWKEVIEKFVL